MSRDSTVDVATELPVQQADQVALALVLEEYLIALEQGTAPSENELIAAHAHLANELRPYLDSLQLLHAAVCGLRESPAANFRSPSAVEGERRQIGDYQIVREVGRGGMGIVYEAHQTSLNRRVALKILPFAAVLDQRQIARFRNEAQAAAQLHHPHIVPVFAVGQEQGVYYYAMQFIEGQSLQQAIDDLRRCAADLQRRSTVATRGADRSTAVNRVTASRSSLQAGGPSEFFRTVARVGQEAAEALHHAHERGILHRDIKPSNLLLDATGKVWVTDFGLARVQTDSRVTLTGDVVGTLRYMSPEQATGQVTLVDARTDIYALGATLYELVTQRQAHAAEDRQALLRQIVEDEPAPPRRICPSIPVDLETIILTATAKSREDRYDSAQALADDLKRFLTGRPTLARRPSLGDRAAKWARRHRSLVAIAASSLVLMSLLSAAGVILLMREQAQTRAALDAATIHAQSARESFDRAERHFLLARDAVDQFGLRLADRLVEIPGAEAVRRDLLIETLRYYHTFLADAGDDPKLRQEVAVARFKSAVIAAKLGAADEAIGEYRTAIDLLTELASLELSPTVITAQLAVSRNNLALLLAAHGESAAARHEFDAAIELQRELVRAVGPDSAFAGQLAESQANLGMLLEQTGDTTGAERSLRGAVDVLRRLSGLQPDEPQYKRNLAIACNNLSYLLRKRDPASAEALSREAIAFLEQLTIDWPAQHDFQDDLALCHNNLAAMASFHGHIDEAIDGHQAAIRIQEQLARRASDVVRYRSDLAISLNNLGVAFCRGNRFADADTAFARAREIFDMLVLDYPSQPTYLGAIAALLNNQALALADCGRHADALPIYAAAVEKQRLCRDRLPESALMRELLSKAYFNQGRSLVAVGDYDSAFASALQRRELWPRDGERLFGIAVELTGIARSLAQSKSDEQLVVTQNQIADEVIATLELAAKNGWVGARGLTDDPRFSDLLVYPRFLTLVGQENQ
jgi:serine/threonine protein kinase/tetratricopeptide (TPR) repeat protein